MKKWSLNFKIIAVLSLFVVASAIISVVGLTKMSDMNVTMNGIVDGDVNRMSRSQELKYFFSVQNINEKNFILEETKEGMSEIAGRMKKTHVELTTGIEELFKLVVIPENKEHLAEFKELYEAWWENSLKVQAFSLAADNKSAFELSKTQGRKLRLKGETILEKMMANTKNRMHQQTLNAADEYSKARVLLLAVCLSAILAGFSIAAIVLRTLNRSIDQVISSLTDNSNQVTSAAQQIASSSEELSQAATEQASSLEETAASVEELNSMIQKNADNARATSEVAMSTRDSSNKGREVISEMIGAIDDIKVSNTNIMEQINLSNQKISEIVKVIAEIGNKTKVINDIVFQTKLLSFNASVEAARAGEHGKGFAVVAEEVGNLAQMSGNAAKEITSMLDESILKVESIVSDTKQKVEHLILDGKHKVESGTRIAKECGVVLEEIVKNVSSVTQMANEISTACQEQAQGVQEITKAMNQLDQVTQTNAATSEEAASSAEELSAQADSLRAVVGTLVVTIKGGEAKAPVTGTASVQRSQKTAATGTNVVRFKPAKQSAHKQFSPTEMKQAVGFQRNSVPAENDPRFEEC